MRLDCPRCGRVLEYSGNRPSFCAYCGKPLPASPDSTASLDPEAATLPPPAPACEAQSFLPERVGGCRLVRPLGTGGMGTVYEAEDIATGRRVALKLIAPEFAGSPETAARFRQEGRLASQVVHPRCVFVHKADEEAGLPFIVMELMPGMTLHDLVQEKGPLASQDAVTKILDVIEGLQEAHRLGIIHRDVKPSNCFLEADGRVKVGDFGLSRSLLSDSRLTRTGSFLGTPLYASPEQIRADPLDAQTDLYSVAATLYFLLTGRAPHQTGDAAATMARIVSEAAPPLRVARPELSAKLDDVVRTGLERDRGRRWANLEEFRQALLPFAPGRLPAAGRVPRLAAFLLDCLLLSVLGGGGTLLWIWLTRGGLWGFVAADRANAADFAALEWLHLVGVALWIAYFGILEGVWGASLGKWLFDVRVATPAGYDPPGVPRALLRVAVLEAVLFLGSHLEFLFQTLSSAPLGPETAPTDWRIYTIFGGYLLGITALLAGMRSRNGWRGLHEWASGTRTISRLPREQRLVVPSRRLEQDVTRPAGLPERLGPYAVLGLLAERRGEQVLLGQDPALGRKALLWLRPAGACALPPARGELTRAGRPRWLSGGWHGDRPWDAFVAPAGCSLADLAARHGRLTWANAQPLLEQLVEELTASRRDQTLPPAPSVGQVWVQPDGKVCLLDMPLDSLDGEEGSPQATVEEQAWALARAAAVLSLEGVPLPKGANVERIRAPLPGPAAQLFQELFGQAPANRGLDRWRDGLAALRDQPARVTPAMRLAHLGVLTALLAFGLICMFVIAAQMSVERIKRLENRLADYGEALQILGADAAASAVAAAASFDPFLRVSAAYQAAYWQERADGLRQFQQRVQRTREALARSHSGPLLQLALWNASEREPAGADGPTWLAAYRLRRSALESDFAEIFEGMGVALYLFVLTFPVAWVVWAFLFRGGFSYRLTGLALVCDDGRPAARWQCGLRALLVWAPVVGLLCFTVGLEGWYVSVYEGGAAHAWAPLLAWASWWLALLLLPAYALLALRLPERSLHDRIVGTWLVPR